MGVFDLETAVANFINRSLTTEDHPFFKRSSVIREQDRHVVEVDADPMPDILPLKSDNCRENLDGVWVATRYLGNMNYRVPIYTKYVIT